MVSIVSSFAHFLMRKAVNSGYKKFKNNINELESVQRDKLRQLLSLVADVNSDIDDQWDWETFSSQLPVTTYDDWRETVEAQLKGDRVLINAPVSRYQPTSGSTSKFKLIPYTDLFLKELDNAIMPWFGSLYEQYPNLRKGKQYWSLSWLPQSRRELMQSDVNDDSKLLSWGKRLLALLTQSVPQGVVATSSVEDSIFATLAYIVADKDLTLLSVWSPTFAINLLDNLNNTSFREELIQTLKTAKWAADRQDSLKELRAPNSSYAANILASWSGGNPEEYQKLWPQLAMISSWDTAMSVYWAQELKNMFPFAQFQGKGLWMTEGVITIPWEDTFILAYHSHFYEFEILETGEVIPSWQLKEGQEVIPIISTGSGFLRYKTSDLIKITGFVGKVPTIEFIGRTSGVDLVGEKLSPDIAQTVLSLVCDKDAELTPVSLLALDTKGLDDDSITPCYLMLMKGDKTAAECHVFAEQAEAKLQESFHYELARNLGQLAPLRVYCQDDAKDRYVELCLTNDMIEGDIKFEPLKYCDNNTLIAKLLN